MKRKALEEAVTNTVPSEALPSWQQDGQLLNWLQSLGRKDMAHHGNDSRWIVTLIL